MDIESKDLLKSLSSNLSWESRLEDRDEEIELTLGLSLNGLFGVDPIPMKPSKLARSSSIPKHTSAEAAATAASGNNLMRTCSLPVEPEEEVRKRKEMQCLRRMEAKRKRIEKQRNMTHRAAAAPVPIPMKSENRVLKGLSSEKLRNRCRKHVLSSSRCGSHSQGSHSESESLIIEVGTSDSGAETVIPEPNGQTQLDHIESEPNREAGLVRCPILGTGMKNQFNKLTVSDNGTKESLVRNMMLNMPCVSTQGDGPDGKRIEGVLYRYNKSEEVRIVCVCHGKFMSPADFVKHAGGTDVGQPLKHIVVTPSAFL